MERFNTNPLKQLRNRINHAKTLNIVLGAGDVWYGPEWIATNQEELDVTDDENWAYLFGIPIIDNVFAEHVWEHLTHEQAFAANENIYRYLKPYGNFRIAVPDGLHPDAQYINYVKPGGNGAGAQDHKVLYNFVTISRMLIRSGFIIRLVEFWDGDGNFNTIEWDESKGRVQRSLKHDERNENGTQPNYTSLFVDATKPATQQGTIMINNARKQWDVYLNEIEAGE